MRKTRADAKPVTLTIDDIEVTVPEGTTVLDAAKAAGIYVPYLCAHPALRPWGACRMCTVEIQNARGIPTSCTTPVAPGMLVKTNTDAVQNLRRDVMELILTEHPIGCLSCHKRDQCGPQETCLRSVAVDFRCVTCPANYRCELQLNADYVGLDEIAMPIRTKNIPLRKDPLIALDWNLCIVCGRCVRVCDEARTKSVYAMVERSGKTMIDTAYGGSMEDAGCIFCGACVDVCPVGAIEERKNRFAGVADSVAESICNYCSDGCSFRLEQKRGTVIRVAPIWEAEVNGGMYCVKGRFATAEPIHHASRITKPLVRKNGALVESTWDEALGIVAKELGARRGGRIGVVGSVRTTNEASYLLQKLARTALATPHIDTTARLSDIPGLLGLHSVLGVGASTNSHDDVGLTKCLLVIGSDITKTSPVTGMKVLQAVRRQVKVARDTGYFSYLPDVGVREYDRPLLIVIDPHETELAKLADHWLRPAPGTDQALLAGILKVIVNEGLVSAPVAATPPAGYDELLASLETVTLDAVAALTGVAAADITAVARAYAGASDALAIFGTGITQQTDGTAAVKALATLAVVTGNIGRPGAGILAPLSANNTRGALDLGCLPEFLTGYQDASDEFACGEIGAKWGSKPVAAGGKRLLDQFEAARSGDITAMYIVGANPAQSAPAGAQLAAALQGLQFLVVQDLYLTETASIADVVLPASTFAEQDGTFTNAERLVQRIRRAIPPVGESRPDWQIIAEIGRRLGASGFDAIHPREVFEEINSVTSIYAGIDYDKLDDGAARWPVSPQTNESLEAMPIEPMAIRLTAVHLPAQSNVALGVYPVLLSLGSHEEQFGTGTQTRLVREFSKFHREEQVDVNPLDASRFGISDGDLVRVESAYGSVMLRAHTTSHVMVGSARTSVAFAEAGTNRLFGNDLDPQSGTPATKRLPVRFQQVT